jgi:hypothetical protein
LTCTLVNGNTLVGSLPTDKQLRRGNSVDFPNFCFILGFAYDFGVCISSQDIVLSRIQNHLCIGRLNACDWVISGVGTVCIVVGF